MSLKIDFSKGPFIMGIVNATPDSFYSGSRYAEKSIEQTVNTVLGMVKKGADIIDIGGESSRPGSDYIDLDEELKRVIPLVKEIRKKSDVLISIDTRKSEVAKEAIKYGAEIINDISALRDDPDMACVIRESGVYAVLMHMQGSPKTMQHNPVYNDTINDIKSELRTFCLYAENEGIKSDKIIIDPGIGFGKTLDDNLKILKYLDEFKSLGYPILMALSRKSFIGSVLEDEKGNPRPVQQRLTGSLAANFYSLVKGADILRVHDIAESSDILKVFKAIEKQEK